MMIKSVDVHIDGWKARYIYCYKYMVMDFGFQKMKLTIVGARAAGVKGINLKDDDFVVSGEYSSARQ